MVFPDLFHIPEPVGRGKRLAVQRAGDGAQLQPAHLVFLQRFIATQDIVQLPVFAVHMDSLYGASIIRDFNIVVCAVGIRNRDTSVPAIVPKRAATILCSTGALIFLPPYWFTEPLMQR